jgi:class 3 adenylate cyclase/predicted ATPase
MGDVARWLTRLGFAEFIAAFEENGIDFDSLRGLTNSDLKDLGVSRLVDRKRLLSEIAALPTEPSEPTPERRLLSVLFCDLVGSTPLSQQLDIEEFRAAMRSYEFAVTQSLGRYEGYVANYLGDGVVAYFGWPHADEEQACQAVRAALEMIDTVRQLDLESGVALHCRVGIATGQVVVGGDARKGSAFGPTPNLAARLQSEAVPDHILVDTATRSLIGSRFELRRLPPASLKGFEQTVDVWEVVGENKYLNHFEALRGTLARLVGRDKELRALHDLWQCARSGQGKLAAVTGEAGIGKSRLAREFEEQVDGPAVKLLRYQCSPHHESSAFHPIIHSLEKAASFDTGSKSAESRLGKIVDLFREGAREDDRVEELLASLMSLPYDKPTGLADLTPIQRRRLTIELLVGDAIRHSRTKPTLLVLEDVHWIDPSSLELLKVLVDRIENEAVMIVVTYRATWPGTLPGDPKLVTLEPLGDDDIESIARSVGRSSLSDDNLRKIVSRVDGIPLFAEELASAALGQQFGGRPDSDLPETIQASVMSKLDMLNHAKFVAQVASVFGRKFRRSELDVLVGGSRTSLSDSISRLVKAGLLLEDSPRNENYQFKHALVRDVAYDSLSRKRRADFHRQLVYQVLLKTAPPREPEVVAYHLTEAGQLPEAIEYWKAAGYRALKASAYVESLAHFYKGLELVEKLPDRKRAAELEFSLRVGLIAPLIAAKGYTNDELEATISRALVLSEAIGKTPEIFPVLYSRWAFLLTTGSMLESYALAREFSSLAVRQSDDDALLARYRMLGGSQMCVSELAAAALSLDKGISDYDTEKHERLKTAYGVDIRVACRSFKGEVLWLLGQQDSARASTAKALEEAKAIGHLNSIAMSLFFCGLVSFLYRDEGAVESYITEMIQLAGEHPIGTWPVLGRSMLGWSQLSQNDAGAGLRMMTEGVEKAANLGVSMFMPFFNCRVAEVRLRIGLAAEADALISATEELINRTGERNYVGELERLKGELQWRRGENGSAERTFQRAIDIARAQGATSIELRAATTFAQFLGERDNAGRGAEVLSAACRQFTEGEGSPDMTAALSTLDKLRQ